MPTEIELKAYAKNLNGIKETILGMGAKPLWQGEQIDTYYKHPSRNFAATDEALRVREQEGTTLLTYKGPKLDAISKTREEIEVQIEDGNAIKELLKKLGFTEAGRVRKHREKLRLDEFEFCLDKVDNLGEFVEIEALLPSEDSNVRVDAMRNSMLETLERLGLKEKERRSYLELLYPKLP